MKILFLVLLYCSSISFVFADEIWDCSQRVVNRSGTMDSSCSFPTPSTPIACYEEIQENCTERTTGRTRTSNYTSFTGSCASSYGECW